MLNKKICKRCKATQYAKVDFEENWKERVVCCLNVEGVNTVINHKSKKYLTFNLFVTDEPPEKCPYVLEHLVCL